jgi:hypothetical protein
MGITRVWNEPEAGGESYIPHANDSRRPGAKAILQRTAGILGGSVQWHANGAVYAQPMQWQQSAPDPAYATAIAGLGARIQHLEQTLVSKGIKFSNLATMDARTGAIATDTAKRVTNYYRPT